MRDDPQKKGCSRHRPRPLARCAKRDPEPASAPQQAEYYETNPKNGGTAEAASARPSAGQTSTPFVDVGAPRAPETHPSPRPPTPGPGVQSAPQAPRATLID